MKKVRIPLYERLRDRWEAMPVSFHVPGHHYGRTLQAEPFDWFRTIMRLDVTELADTDDLHHPEGVILEAERLAARCFGAEETFLLVGGSTAGNLAMILATCAQDDIVIVQRNVHKSIGNGIRLAGARAVFVRPQFDPVTGTATIPQLADLERALEAYPHAKAVILSTPNYYGVSIGLTRYAELVHRYGMPLLIDEAHGAHYGFHPDFPSTAIQAGADAVVQSTHKTLTALTMGAMLHVQGPRIDRQALRDTLSTVQSSSPSYPIMASLDIARAMVESEGPALFSNALEDAERLRRMLRDKPPEYPIALFGHGNITPEQPFPTSLSKSMPLQRDPLRMLLTDRSGTVSGYELLRRLALSGCEAEMANDRFVVLLFGIGTTSQDVDRLLAAIESIAGDIIERHAASGNISCTKQQNPGQAGGEPEAMFDALSPPFRMQREVSDDRHCEHIPLTDAANRIAAEPVIPYPPGIPLLYPGEPISESAIRQITGLASKGARFQGASDPAMHTIRVRKEQANHA